MAETVEEAPQAAEALPMEEDIPNVNVEEPQTASEESIPANISVDQPATDIYSVDSYVAAVYNQKCFIGKVLEYDPVLVIRNITFHSWRLVAVKFVIHLNGQSRKI